MWQMIISGQIEASAILGVVIRTLLQRIGTVVLTLSAWDKFLLLAVFF